jgi:hypothetical protein
MYATISNKGDVKEMNTEEEYLNAINEIIENQSSDCCDRVIPDAHWWTDLNRQSMVLTNDREQYAIFFRYIGGAKDLHYWVRHLSGKHWVGKETLEEFVRVWQDWRDGKTVACRLVKSRERTVPENGMLASEVHAIWLRYETSDNILRNDLLAMKLRRGDYRINTTPELMAISESFERNTMMTNNPPESCTSCKDYGIDSHMDWTFGHRPGWWVCAQCKSVWACRCRTPDDDGNCDQCGRKMSREAIDAYREDEAKEWAFSQSLIVANDGSIELELNEYPRPN